MGALLLPSCGSDVGKIPQHSTPALDSLLADTSLMGEDAVAPAKETAEVEVSSTPAKLTLQNDLDYSAVFLKKLTYAGLAKNIELLDSLLILEQKDSFVFPMDLPKAKWVNFVAMKSGYMYALDVSRANYTTLNFNFELRKGRTTIDQIRGKADLNPGFVLGSESDEDDRTGISYFANEYFFEDDACSFSIRIGDDAGIKKVKIIKECKSGKYNIALEDCPVLLEK